MLTTQQIKELVRDYGNTVSSGRSISELISERKIQGLETVKIDQGKVSDSVYGKNLITKDGRPIRLMYRNNRISTHDQNRGLIPFKDQVLALNHDHMLSLVKGVLLSSQFEIPGLAANSTVIPSENLHLIKLENVVRAYMARSSTSTSLYQHWIKAKKSDMTEFEYAGHPLLANQLEANCKLPYPMDTPSTKEKNDMTVNRKYLLENTICTEHEYNEIRNGSLVAFGIVSQYLKEKGMVLVDVKTEHGIDKKGKIRVADELYTMDSARFWKLDETGEIMLKNGEPISFSKEFAREMVKNKDHMFTPEETNRIAVRYIEGLQLLTGKEFVPDLRPRDERIIESTDLILNYLL